MTDRSRVTHGEQIAPANSSTAEASNLLIESGEVAASTDKGGKQPDIVRLVVHRRLRDGPRVRRPGIVVLEIRLSWRLLQWRLEIALTQSNRWRIIAAIARRPRRRVAA